MHPRVCSLRRLIANTLAISLLWLSPGLECYQVLAQDFRSADASAALSAPRALPAGIGAEIPAIEQLGVPLEGIDSQIDLAPAVGFGDADQRRVSPETSAIDDAPAEAGLRGVQARAFARARAGMGARPGLAAGPGANSGRENKSYEQSRGAAEADFYTRLSGIDPNAAPRAGRTHLPAASARSIGGANTEKWFGEVPLLGRVLSEAKISWNLPGSFRVLLVDPKGGPLEDRRVHEALSKGKALISEVRTGSAGHGAGGAALEEYFLKPENRRQYRGIVAPAISHSLPSAATPEGKSQIRKIQLALQKLDQVADLSDRLQSLESRHLEIGRDEALEIQRLTGGLRLSRYPIGIALDKLDTYLQDMWHHMAATWLKDVETVHVFDAIYEGLKLDGAAIFPFEDNEPGLATVEKLLTYWTAKDGGRFIVKRVDLPDGSRVLVAQKDEPTVEMWLKPADGRVLKKSFANISGNPDQIGEPKAFLREAGFSDAEIEQFSAEGLTGAEDALLLASGFNREQILQFREAGMEIRHVFDADTAKLIGNSFGYPVANRLYVRLPRAQSKALKRFGEFSLEASRKNFKLHVIQSARLQKVKQVWKLKIFGAGRRIFDVDTGLDVTHPDFAGKEIGVDDLVNDGPYDEGHGTHKASTEYGNGKKYKGMAPGAIGRMAKVFSRKDPDGASDGDIIAALTIKMKEFGASVGSLSIGSNDGSADEELSSLTSSLALEKNKEGLAYIITASAGNEGPWFASVGEPAAGPHVIAVGSVNKGLEDGKPEVSFFSSVGPSLYRRLLQTYGLLRIGLKPEILAVGGDVVDGKDMFKPGVEAAKSKYMEKSPSDASDGLHTRMAGTSMSNPMIAGIAADIEDAVLMTADKGSDAFKFFADNTAFAVKMILMRSAADLGVPVFYQGAGMVDAEAAVKLAIATFGDPKKNTPADEADLRKKIGSGMPVPGTEGFAWVERAKAVWDLEEKAYAESVKAADGVLRGHDAFRKWLDSGRSMKKLTGPERKSVTKALKAAKSASRSAFEKYSAEAAAEIEKYLDSSGEPAWIVRFYAAFSLINLKSPATLESLAKAASADPDARVRQAALLAIGSQEPDAKIDAAVKSIRSPYAAYSLAAHGDASRVSEIIDATHHRNKSNRFTAAWLLSQLGARADKSAPAALAALLSNHQERPNIRHLAAASFAEVADDNPAALTPGAVLKFVKAVGPGSDILMDTVVQALTLMGSNKKVVEIMNASPLRAKLAAFVKENKSRAGKDNQYAAMLAQLARILKIPLGPPRGKGSAPSTGGAAREHMRDDNRAVPAGKENDVAAWYARGASGEGYTSSRVAAKSLGRRSLSRISARLLKRESNLRRAELPSGPASPQAEVLTPSQIGTLKDVMSFGVVNSAGYTVDAFVFKPWVDGKEGDAFKARGRGLEGFLWSWLETEDTYGEAALLHHANDFFNYAGDILEQGRKVKLVDELYAEVRKVRESRLSDLEKMRRLRSLLKNYVPRLQQLVEANRPSSWAQNARIYEIFSAEYNLPGKRAAFGLPARPQQKFFADFGPEDFAIIKKQGFDTIWTMGIYPIGQRGRVGEKGSPYSIQDHRGIDPDLGAEQDFKAFVERAHAAGLKVIVDFVPNHSSMDSRELAEHPEYYITREVDPGRDPHQPPDGFFDYYSAKLGRWIWVSHGGYDNSGRRSYWSDTAQFDISNIDAQKYLAGAAADMVKRFGFDGFRVDMAYQVTNLYFGRNWGRKMPKQEFLDLLLSTVRAVKPEAAFMAEIYDLRDNLSAMGFDSTYNKNDMDMASGQYGWYDAWMKSDLGKIRQALRDISFAIWQKSGATLTQFPGNHDESSVQRRVFGGADSGIGQAWRAMMLMSALLPGSYLFYGSQEVGYDRPEPDEVPKSISFKHRNPIDWAAGSAYGNPEVRKFSTEELFPKVNRVRRDLGPRPAMQWIEPAGGNSEPWAGYLLAPSDSSPVKDKVYLVLGQQTDKEVPVHIMIPRFGINYAGTLKPGSGDVVEFHIPSVNQAKHSFEPGLETAMERRRSRSVPVPAGLP